MKAEQIIFLVIVSYAALIVIIIGIMQIRKKTPTGFYSGEEPPKPDEIKDVAGWNKKHGMMWILYGVVIEVGAVIGVLSSNEGIFIAINIGSVIIPLPIMMLYHHILLKK